MINVVYKNVALYRNRQINNSKLSERCHRKSFVGREKLCFSKGDKENFMKKLTLEAALKDKTSDLQTLG